MASDHDHAGQIRSHSLGPAREMQRRALWISLFANGGFFVAEVIGGLAFHSLALLADAAQMVSDVVGLSIALVAQRLLSRPATARHSYGFQRAEAFGRQFNGLTLLAVAGWIIYEAIGRLGQPAHVEGRGVLVVATLGLIVNLGSALLLARSRGRSVNMKGAYLHMAVDAAGSVAAIVAALAIIFFHANWVDPAVSVGIAVLVLWSAWSLLKDTTNVMLEGSPGDISLTEVEDALVSEDNVSAVHHTHLWSIASDVTAFSGHVVLEAADLLHDAQEQGDQLKSMLAERFSIDHATLELECHPCVGEETPHDRHP
ncbi:MAG: cation diffusion facilitator family transporter [Acidimicrobiales bacterium]